MRCPGHTASRTGIALAVALVLAACGTAGEARPSSGIVTGSTPASARTGPVTADAEGVPYGAGSALPDDVNGDGYADAVITAEASPQVPVLAVLYGSRGGLDAGRRTVVRFGGRELFDFAGPRHRRPDTADLDGDGYADIPVILRAGLRIVWGGPEGPAGGLSPVVPVPDVERIESDWPAAGDFDGDGHADLALAAPYLEVSDIGGYAVLYGPFGRNGRPSRTYFSGPGPVNGPGRRVAWIVPDGIRPGGRTGLILHAADDGEQTGATYLTRVPSGRGRPLGPGNAVAVGDFDGDGRRDVAVGDDGSRNDEPGAETIGATSAITVYGGRAPQAPIVIDVPGIHGALTAGDVDGDGRDDLLLQDGGRVELLRNGLTARRALGPFSCREVEGGRPGALRAGDYDRDGRAEVLVTCWTAASGPDPHRLWVWEDDGRVTFVDIAGFAG
ncbi:FG-GAP and VCBS repeat-containing protein [Microbispora hainanensis]|uniref:VCBS repeat-containing protein n=1 Tax=Microbispora hainanensis TaxID=568844 RepID=A0A544Z589_9ACTN|nr:FG-GAP and VCBS repeat-containing protein [Microbispora hainanensis]TQS24217.1 VCBS repeat-containing protein [Microbispora hainanensis]